MCSGSLCPDLIRQPQASLRAANPVPGHEHFPPSSTPTPLSFEHGTWFSERKLGASVPSSLRIKEALFPLLSPQRGYDDLQTIVPTCQQQDFSIGSQKLSKAIVLQKSMARESPGSGWGLWGCEEARAFYPLSAWPWWRGGYGRLGERGVGGKRRQSQPCRLRLPLCPPPPQPLTTSSFCTRRRKSRRRRCPCYARTSRP